MTFKFNIRVQEVDLSFIQAEESVYGTVQITKQAVITFANGRSWVMPLPLLEQLLLPTNPESQLFLEGLIERFAPPKPQAMPDFGPDLSGVDVTPKDNGGFSVKFNKDKKK
jgi:hypothetical protein